ncbi:MAG: PKD domain-containing protein [Candidatus Pacebacteria bacterium]|nr:PKD domain-containing protein [Candidatus Paceibacterota bacterium]
MESINFSFKKLFYLSCGLGLIVVTLLVLQVVFPVQTIDIPSVEGLIGQVNINWDLLRKPIAILPPSLEVALAVSSPTTTEGSLVDLTAEVTSVVQGPFIYHFDCQSDGVFELETESSFQKEYTALGLCQYDHEGTSTASVLVDGFLDYFQNGQEVKEKRTAQAFSNITITSGNSAPVFSFCDVDSIEGTTQVNFIFNFASQAQDKDGDEISFEWDFGDGNKAQGNDTEYSYKTEGFYVPKVTATDSKGGYSVCVAKSLTILKGLSAFEQPKKPEQLGRENPFIAPSKTSGSQANPNIPSE